MKFRTAAPAAIATLALALAACGGGGDRPSASELSDKFQAVGADEETADCVADVLVNSDISDGALRDFLEADLDDDSDLSDIPVSDDDEAAGEAVEADIQECILGDVDLPDVSVPDEGE